MSFSYVFNHLIFLQKGKEASPISAKNNLIKPFLKLLFDLLHLFLLIFFSSLTEKRKLRIEEYDVYIFAFKANSLKISKVFWKGILCQFVFVVYTFSEQIWDVRPFFLLLVLA